MRTKLTAILVSAAILAGCDSSEPEQSQTRQIKVRSAEQDRLHQLAPIDRAIALRRAIYDAGYRCERVEESGFVGPYKNLDMWTAACADGRQWAVFAGPDGSAQVRDCRDVAKVGLPECKVAEQPGDAPATNSAAAAS